MNVIGQRFGRFQILREIGKGALARVFLASDGREVKAVKVFPAAARDRAERELRAGKGLLHPCLNPVEEAVEIGGLPALVMPFVPGVQLGRWRRGEGGGDPGGGPRSPEVFLATFRDLLAGLGHLHELGTVHRDVKPENVLVDRSGRARLLDFDLAVRADERPRAVVAGTVAYLSPEGSRGGPVSAASDLYAAGAILFLGLAGEVPFTGSVEEVVDAHRHRPARRVSELAPALERYDPLLASMLAKDPAARPATARDVLAALDALEPR